MAEILIQRRSLILGAVVTLFAAPAIVRASNLMAIKPFDLLAATGFQIPIDLELNDFLAQYRSFQKGFLSEYKKEKDPVKAQHYDVNDYSSRWSGASLMSLLTPTPRESADDAGLGASLLRRSWIEPEMEV
jgi:hypothetical protein